MLARREHGVKADAKALTLDTHFKNKFVWLVLAPTVVVLGFIFFPFVAPITLALVCALATSQVKIQMKGMKTRQRVIYRYSLLGIAVVGISVSVSAFRRIYALTIGDEKAALSEIMKKSSGAVREQVDQLIQFVQSNVKLFGIRSTGSATNYIEKFAQDTMGVATKYIGGVFVNLPNLLLALVTFGVCYYYFYKKEHILAAKFQRMFSVRKQDFNPVMEAAHESAYSAIVTNIVTGFFQAAVLTIGASMAGINEWTVVFFLSYISALMPVVGTLPVSIVLLLYSYAFLESSATITILIAAIIASVIDNVLRPIILSKNQTQMNSFVAFLAVIGAVVSFGFVGFFIGPFALVFFTKLVPLLSKKPQHANVVVVSESKANH